MHKIVYVLVFVFAQVAWSQNARVKVGCNIPYYQLVVRTLAHDSMEGRLPGTISEKKAADFIISQFKKAGCKPLQNAQYVYPFTYKNPDSLITQSTGNVVAKIETRSTYCIVISAHYDHIGRGKWHSTDPFSKAVHNGADDNASGVAMMLGLAAWCKQHKSQLQYDLVFIGFSGEEDGLFGAKHFLTQNLVDTSRIICNLNFDMVGHLDTRRPLLELDGALEHPAWDLVLPADTNPAFVTERSRNMIKGGADHQIFLDAGIPALLISTGVTSFYHRPQDDVSTINFTGMEAIGLYLQQLLRNLNKIKNLELYLK
jgi:hypothetical protein